MKEDQVSQSVDSLVVRCDGNHEGSGHPRVFLHMNKEGYVICPYCGCEFYDKSKKTK